MELRLERTAFNDVCTVGELFVNDVHECWTLEDVVRINGPKIFGETAIPAGTYDVDITPSAKFGRDLPLLMHVQNYEGIRIHVGNTAKDTLGCILVGQGKATNAITQSTAAFNALFAKLSKAKQDGEPIRIVITNAGAPIA